MNYLIHTLYILSNILSVACNRKTAEYPSLYLEGFHTACMTQGFSKLTQLPSTKHPICKLSHTRTRSESAMV